VASLSIRPRSDSEAGGNIIRKKYERTIIMEYNRPHATATWGTMATDWEAGVDFRRLIKERFEKAQAAVKSKGLGAVLCFNFDNIRYVTGTHIGEWCRDKMNRYALCPREGGSFLFDPAVPAKRISSPWMEDRMEPPIANMLGALPPAMNVQDDFARQIKRVLTDYGVEKEPLGIDMLELSMLRALEKEGIEVVDGQQAMLDARECKTEDEIELLKQAASMVDATYEDIARAIRPGIKENELVALAIPVTIARSYAANPINTRSRPTKRPRNGSARRSMPSSQGSPRLMFVQFGPRPRSSDIAMRMKPTFFNMDTA